MNDKETTSDHREFTLEPRVAKLEVGLDRLTEDVKDLAGIVRAQGQTVESEIQKLVVAVTQAQGPRKTEWGVIIAGVGLTLAIGTAAFVPLNQTAQETKAAIERYHESMVEHQKMDNHPVGQAKIEALVKEMDMTKLEFVKRNADLDTKIQKETQLMTDLLSANITALDKRLQVEMGLKNDLVIANQKSIENGMKAHERQDELEGKLAAAELRVVKEKNDLYIDKLYGRVVVLEGERAKMADKEHDELMSWRQKAMGLSSPNATVPLLTREAVPGDAPKK